MYEFDPERITAYPGKLQEAGAQLTSIANSITTLGTTISGSIWDGAVQFSEVVGGEIAELAPEQIAGAETLFGVCSYASGVFEAFGDDISDYQSDIGKLEAEYQDRRVDYDPTTMDIDVWEEQRRALVAELTTRAEDKNEDLEEQATTRNTMLIDGPTPAHLQELIGSGHLPWFLVYNLWGSTAAGDPTEEALSRGVDRAGNLLDGDDPPSEEQLQAAVTLLGLFGEEDLFATQLLARLGPERLLELSAVVGQDTDGEYGRQLAFEAQRHLGIALGTASHVESMGDWNRDDWIDRLLVAGAASSRDGVDYLDHGQLGYDALAPLLQHGTHHAALLTPVGEHILHLYSGEISLDPAFSLHTANAFDAAGNLTGNPMNAVLDAMGRNPAAALDFFYGGSEHSRDDYDVPALPWDLPPMLDGQLDSLQFLLGAGELHALGFGIDPGSVGGAIEAAVTGLPPGSPLTSDRPIHTAEMVDVLARTMRHVDQNWESFLPSGNSGGMAENFGNITVHYLEDFYQALASDPTESWVPESHGESLASLFPFDSDYAGGIGKAASEVGHWLAVVGADPAAATSVFDAGIDLMAPAVGTAIGESPNVDSGEGANAAAPFGGLVGWMAEGAKENEEAMLLTRADERDGWRDPAAWLTTAVANEFVGRVDVPVINPLEHATEALIHSAFDLGRYDPEQDIVDARGNINYDQVSSMLAAAAEEVGDADLPASARELYDGDDWETIVEQVEKNVPDGLRLGYLQATVEEDD